MRYLLGSILNNPPLLIGIVVGVVVVAVLIILYVFFFKKRWAEAAAVKKERKRIEKEEADKLRAKQESAAGNVFSQRKADNAEPANSKNTAEQSNRAQSIVHNSVTGQFGKPANKKDKDEKK